MWKKEVQISLTVVLTVLCKLLVYLGYFMSFHPFIIQKTSIIVWIIVPVACLGLVAFGVFVCKNKPRKRTLYGPVVSSPSGPLAREAMPLTSEQIVQNPNYCVNSKYTLQGIGR